MARFTPKIRAMARQSLVDRDVEFIEGYRVKEVTTGRITLDSGESHDVDLIFLALGVKPSAIFASSGLAMGPDGGLLVNRFLQCPAYPELFGGGDCISFAEHPLDKVGVYAVRENPILFQNLMAALENQALMPFDPGGNYLLIFNLGEGMGIFKKSWLTFGGRTAFTIKDWIDRRFMKKFQAMEK